MKEVTLIGSGKVAFHFYHAIQKMTNFKVCQWYARDITELERYKKNVPLYQDFEGLTKSHLCIIAVSDDAIAMVSQKLAPLHHLLVHTSGVKSLHFMDKKHARGVLYPVQTFSKQTEINFSEVPFCIEVENKKQLSLLKEFTAELGSPTFRLSTEKRRIIHLAAVFANNFTNQLYRIAHEITDYEGISFDVLKPLILQTAQKISEYSPYAMQTGPAVRGDQKTIQKHLEILDNSPHKEIYTLITKSIMKTHGKKL